MQRLLTFCLTILLFTACTKQIREGTKIDSKEGDADIGITPQISLYGLWVHRDYFSGTSGFGNAECVFELNGKAYVYGWGSLYTSGELWEYDDQTITWTRKADLPGPFRTDVSVFSINGRGYLVAGIYVFSSHFQKELWEYNPATNTWTKKADFPGAARFKGVSFAINGKGYFGIGSHFSQVYNDFYEYNPTTNSWTQRASFPGLGRQDAFSFAASGKGYLGTGRYFSISPSIEIFLKDLWEYNPSTNSWIQKANYPGGQRIACASFTEDNHGFVGTGYDPINDKYKRDFYEYYPTTNSWTQRSDYEGIARKNAIGFAIGQFGFIGFGETASGDGEGALWRYLPYD